MCTGPWRQNGESLSIGAEAPKKTKRKKGKEQEKKIPDAWMKRS